MAIKERAVAAAPPAGAARRRRGCLRALMILATTFVVLALAVVGLAYYVIHHPLPPANGTLSLPGLSAPVTVVRDSAGMPHITAANSADLFRAQGYVVAQDRLWQMDFFRRVGAGRLSEVLGARQATLDADRNVRTMGWQRAAQKELDALPAADRALLEQYAAGVNAFLASHQDSLPIEFSILGYKPEPWTPLDTVTFGKVMAWDLSENLDLEITMSDLQARLGPARAASLLPAYPDGKATIVGQSALPGNPQGSHPDPLGLARVFGAGDGLIGSNNWVIDGTKSADGHPLLANDPHLGVQNPSIWYAIQLRAQDGSLDVEGVTFAGVPGVVVGHNRDIAWGVTNLGPDTQDLFVETLDPAGHPGQYQYQGTWRPLDVLTETIPVKGEAGQSLTIRSTVHGPLLNTVRDDIKVPAAFAWTALQPGGLLPAVINLDHAKNWAEFHTALSTWDVPGQNFVFADTAGNIGYQATGRWPIRKQGNGLVPVDGASGAYDWTGFVPYDKLPSVYNPPSHFLVTANNRVVGPAYPYLATGWWGPWFRAERITQLLSAPAKLTMDDFKKIQYDTHSPLAVAFGRHLAAVQGGDAPTQQAAALFQNWDGNISTDSVAATIYEVTREQVLTDTFADELGGSLAGEYLDTASGAANELIYTLLDDPQNAWWDDVNTPQVKETRDDILRKALGEAVARLTQYAGPDMATWTWGSRHAIIFGHTLGAAQPLDLLLNLGPFATPGDSYTVNVGTAHWSDEAPYQYQQSSHPSMRLIMSPGDWTRTQLIFAPGESGQVGSPHWGDQIAGWLQGDYRTLPWTADQIGQAAEGTLTLQP